MPLEGYGRVILANATDISAATRYYPETTGDVGLLMNGRTVVNVHMECSGGVTATIEATNEEPSDAAGVALNWVDITAAFTDLNTGFDKNTSWVDTSTIIQANGLCVNRIRIKSVTSDATNGVKYTLRMM